MALESYLPMVIFLAFGAVVNLAFLARSLADTCRRRPLGCDFPSAPPLLLTLALAELCWVLPCFVQCLASIFDRGFAADASRLGCDVMGFYSVLGSIAGQLTSLEAAVLTERALRRGAAATSARAAALAGGAILGFSALIAALPLWGVGRMTFYDGAMRAAGAELSRIWPPPPALLHIFSPLTPASHV